jgi:hypothetical protein
MGNERRGCFLFGIPAMVLGTRRSPALSSAIDLPKLDVAKVHRADLPALVKARKAAESVRKQVLSSDKQISAEVRADVMSKVSLLLEAIYALGERVLQGREFLEKHGPDGLAREKAELEMELIGASVVQIREVKSAMDRLEERAAHSGEVIEALDKLKARMISAGAELQALDARLGSVLGTEILEHELSAYQQSADLALDAFQQTWTELGRLD